MPDLLFYDGTCGLCHWTVRFVLARDQEGSRFRFAPLQGETFAATFSPADRGRFPDSLILKAEDGRVLTRSAAVLHAGERLGGPWRALARLVGFLPRWLLDAGYDGIARVRRSLFARPPDSCPLLPPELRRRFLP